MNDYANLDATIVVTLEQSPGLHRDSIRGSDVVMSALDDLGYPGHPGKCWTEVLTRRLRALKLSGRIAFGVDGWVATSIYPHPNCRCYAEAVL